MFILFSGQRLPAGQKQKRENPLKIVSYPTPYSSQRSIQHPKHKPKREQSYKRKECPVRKTRLQSGKEWRHFFYSLSTAKKKKLVNKCLQEMNGNPDMKGIFNLPFFLLAGNRISKPESKKKGKIQTTLFLYIPPPFLFIPFSWGEIFWNMEEGRQWAHIRIIDVIYLYIYSGFCVRFDSVPPHGYNGSDFNTRFHHP